MPCYHPKKMYDCTSILGLTKNNKPSLKYCQYEVEKLYYNLKLEKFIGVSKDDFLTYGPMTGPNYIEMPFYTEIGCGQCRGCRIDHSREWAARMICEQQYHEQSWFLTLTYDDDHLDTIQTYYPDVDTGEAVPALTLNFDDLQDFIKRLRWHQDYYKPGSPKIVYYACGEYGDETFRPHFHMIAYDLLLDESDLEFYKKDKMGFPMFKCKKLVDIWKHGYVVVCPVTFASAAYVARYCTKKLNGDYSKFYDIMNLVPPASRMSLKPGIGYQYYQDHKDKIYEYDRLIVKAADRGLELMPPRYFDKLYALDNPDHFDRLRSRRIEISTFNDEWLDWFTQFDKLDRLEMDERLFNQRTNILLRNTI